jgi:hypothetical protein
MSPINIIDHVVGSGVGFGGSRESSVAKISSTALSRGFFESKKIPPRNAKDSESPLLRSKPMRSTNLPDLLKMAVALLKSKVTSGDIFPGKSSVISSSVTLPELSTTSVPVPSTLPPKIESSVRSYVVALAVVSRSLRSKKQPPKALAR